MVDPGYLVVLAGAPEEVVVGLGFPDPETGACTGAAGAALLAVGAVVGTQLVLEVERPVAALFVVVSDDVMGACDHTTGAAGAQVGVDHLALQLLPLVAPAGGLNFLESCRVDRHGPHPRRAGRRAKRGLPLARVPMQRPPHCDEGMFLRNPRSPCHRGDAAGLSMQPDGIVHEVAGESPAAPGRTRWGRAIQEGHQRAEPIAGGGGELRACRLGDARRSTPRSCGAAAGTESFEAFFEREQRHLLRFCWGLTLDPHEAERPHRALAPGRRGGGPRVT